MLYAEPPHQLLAPSVRAPQVAPAIRSYSPPLLESCENDENGLLNNGGGLGNNNHHGGDADADPLNGMTAKDRVLARREMRKRQESQAREDDLMRARRTYFQERVLADNAQRSQYLGHSLPHIRARS
jgi:hypothetical protein